MSIADQLLNIAQTKAEIKSALEAGGVVVSPTATFRDYASMIGQVKNLTIPTWSYVMPLTSGLGPTVGANLGYPTYPLYTSTNPVTYNHNVNGDTVYSASTPIFEDGALRMLPTIENKLGDFTLGQKIVAMPNNARYLISFRGTGNLLITSSLHNITLNGVDDNTTVWTVFTNYSGSSVDVTYEIVGSCNYVQILTSIGTDYSYITYLVPPPKIHCISPVDTSITFPPGLVSQYTGTVYLEFKYAKAFGTDGYTIRNYLFSDNQLSEGLIYYLNSLTEFNSRGTRITYPAVSWCKLAITYGNGSIKMALNGIAASLTVLNRFAFGSVFKIGSGDYYIKNFKYAPQVIDMDSLIALTA